MKDFWSERARWGVPLQRAPIRNYPSLLGMAKSRDLYETGLPRGALLPRLTADRERMSNWMSPGSLLRHRIRPGQLVIGKLGDTFLGHLDDRPMLTIAGARSGKSSTVLKPNLYLYSGSMLVLDPKGELAAETAALRRAMGHQVHVVDAFGQSGERSACFNCLEVLDPDDPRIIDQVMSIVSALVPDQGGGGNAKHFNDSARALLVGIILFVLAMPDKQERHLVTVRKLLTLSYEPLARAAENAAAKVRTQAQAKGQTSHVDASTFAVQILLNSIILLGGRFGGVAASIGARFLNMPPVERGSVFSTAAVHTDFLDSLLLRRIIKHSDFKLESLRSDRPTTIYLVLPVAELERQFRFLRLIVQMACTTLERLGSFPPGKQPVLFVMEEFAVLGHMKIMEQAAAYFPGFGVKLWIVLQSLQQLINDYRTSYQTILGNAGLVQMFAAGDDPALQYAASWLGKLMDHSEMRQAFSRDRRSQLLLMEGEPPAAAMRLEHEDVALIRRRVEESIRRNNHLSLQ
ncbi:MAG TPA: type IV secretory system conjugative DNA transfer family protein [Pseudolabrys sp.]|nr:type IV secretory system conjugative DNA transfer family protein [Pseudolabrys sp.]